MSLESFYGGKPGVSPVIRKSFKYVSTADAPDDADSSDIMESCFENENYKDVWYGELAIIDAPNRNSPTHGRLYRRVLARSEVNDPDTSHAEYIGTLSGPSGGFPQVVVKTVKDITGDNTIPTTLDYFEDNLYTFPTKGNEDNDVTINYLQKFEGETGKEDFDAAMKNIAPIEATIANNQLVSGKENNSIKYYWVDVVNNRAGVEERTALYLGFQIPYPVVEFKADQIDWTQEFDFIQGEENSNRPFYRENILKIPAGVRGNSVSNLRKKVIQENQEIYDFNKLKFLKNGLLDITSLENAKVEVTGKYAWLFTFTAYGKFGKNEFGENEFSKILNCYIGDVEEIENISYLEDGTITIKYYNKEAQIINKNNLIRYIKDIDYNPNGTITVTYNTKNESRENETETFQWPVLTSLFVNSDNQLRYEISTLPGQNFNAGVLSYIYRAAVLNDTDIPNELVFYRKKGVGGQSVDDDPIRTGISLNFIEKLEMNNETGILTVKTTTDDEEHTYLVREQNQGSRIAAELYINRLKAVKILQDMYYKKEYKLSSNIDGRENVITRVLKKENPTWLDIISIIRNDTWLQPNNDLNGKTCSYWSINKNCLLDTANSFKNWLDSLSKSEIINEVEEEGIIDFYPYENGNVWSFNSMNINVDWEAARKKDDGEAINYEYTTEELAKAILEITLENEEFAKIGQMLFYNGHAFYYDFGADKQWKYAGFWNASSSENGDVAVRKNRRQIASDGNISPSGFYLDAFDKQEITSDKPKPSVFPNSFFLKK